MKDLSAHLLAWYNKFGRDLPWRFRGGAHPNPYHVLVSEFMLQQTTVKTVIPYFKRFIQKFPTIQSLAEASIDDIYQYWQGLGYYSRARSLHETARMIVYECGGRFPKTKAEVLKLKGIGQYTASSFLALGFNLPETVVDGNVIRIICRLEHWTDSVEKIKKHIDKRAAELTNVQNAADYASAIMDLGALICTPKNPNCQDCPLSSFCKSKDATDIEQIPLRRQLAKAEKTGYVYLIYDAEGHIFIRKRTEKGLLSGLYEFPWSEQKIYAEAQDCGKSVSHTFTHFKLILNIYTFQTKQKLLGGKFIKPDNLKNYPVSTLMKKVLKKYKS